MLNMSPSPSPTPDPLCEFWAPWPLIRPLPLPLSFLVLSFVFSSCSLQVVICLTVKQIAVPRLDDKHRMLIAPMGYRGQAFPGFYR